MFKREIGTSQRNSIAYNAEYDDLTYNNYLCLYSIIQSKTINPNNIIKEVNRIKKCFGLMGDNANNLNNTPKTGVATEKITRKVYKYSDIVITDTLTNEVLEFETTTECAKYFGMKASQLNAYIRNKHKVRKRYDIKAKEGGFKTIGLKIILTHTKTGEVKEFYRAVDAAGYINTSATNLSWLNRNDSTTRDGWKVKYIEGE